MMIALRGNVLCVLGLVALGSCGVAGAALADGLPSGATSGVLPRVSVSTQLTTAAVATVPVPGHGTTRKRGNGKRIPPATAATLPDERAAPASPSATSAAKAAKPPTTALCW